MYNPFRKFPVTATWADHRNRRPPSLGGVDYEMPVGTPLPACSAGVVTFIENNGTGGHTATITRRDGSRTQYMHLSAFVGRNGRRVAEGEIVGLSGGAKGAPGAGSSTGPHCHAHDITPQGVRVPPFTTEAATLAALILRLIGVKKMALSDYALFEFKGTKATRTAPAQPREFMLVSPTHLPEGHKRSTDIRRKEVWENIAGKPETVNTYGRFELLADEARDLAAEARAAG